MSETAATLGARLRAERERKGLSAQKAADDMHLDGWVIDALEGDDYARIGPSVYGKGHLKRYAEMLGLPVNDIMAAYEGRSAGPAVVAGAQTSPLRMRASDGDESELPWGLIGGVAAAVFVVAAAVFWWKPWSSRAPSPMTAAATPAPSPMTAAVATPAPSDTADPPDSPSSAVAESSIDTAAERAPTDAVVGSPPTRDSQTLPGAGKARLRLSFSADSWVDVHDAAGHRLYAGSGRANSVKTIAGDAPLKVYLGFASGVQVEVNSRVVAIGPQFVSGDVAHFDAGADGVLRRDSHASATASNSRPHG